GLLALNGQTSLALRLLSVASIAGGVSVFFSHGGRRISVVGIYVLCLGLLTGCSSYYWSSNPPSGTSSVTILAVGTAIYLSTVVTYLLFWNDAPKRTRIRTREPRPPISRFAARYLQVLGLGLFVLGIAASAIGVTVGSLPRTTAEVGIILLGSALILGARETIWRSPFRTLG